MVDPYPPGAIAPAWLSLPAPPVPPAREEAAVEPPDDNGERLVEARAELDGATVAVHLVRAAPPDPLPLVCAVAGGLALAGAACLLGLALWTAARPSSPLFFALAAAGVAGLTLAAALRARADLPRELSIGPGGDLPVPDGTLAAPLPLVRARGFAHELVFPRALEGELTRDGQTTALADLPALGRAWPCELPAVYAAPLDGDCAAQVRLGGLTIFLRTVAAPRRLPARTNPDPSIVTALGGSFAACLAVLAVSLAIPPPAPWEGMSYAFQMHVSLGGPAPATVSRVPIACLGPGCNRPRLPRETGRAGHEDAPARPARALVTIRGPRVNPDTHLSAAARAPDHLAALRAGRETVSQSLGPRALAELRAAASSPLEVLRGLDAGRFGDDAIGNDADNVLGGLVGSQVGDTYGAGGLGLIGTGQGDAGGSGGSISSIGYGRIGTIGHASGDGTGPGYGYGNGMGRLTGRRLAQVTCTLNGCSLVGGGLDKEIIHRIIRRHISEVRYCYARALITQPKLEGRATVRFAVQPSGLVASSEIAESTLGDDQVGACVAGAVRRWEFPKPRGGGLVIVNYPFAFHPGE